MINEKKTKEFLENKNNTFELDLEFLEEKEMKLAEKIQFELLYKHGAYSPVPLEKLVLKKFDSVIEARKALYEKLKSIPYLTLPERYQLTKETNLNKEAILCTRKISVCLVIKEVVNIEREELKCILKM